MPGGLEHGFGMSLLYGKLRTSPVVQAAALSDIGRLRKTNEDTVLMAEELGLFVVADGMGGHNAGEVASELAASAVLDMMREPPLELPDERLSEPGNRILSAIWEANRRVFDLAASDESLTGMGSTIAAVFLHQGMIVAANVGDSPILLFRDGSAIPLFVPHTVLHECLLEGRPVDNPRFGAMLTQAVGVRADVSPDVFEIPAQDGDRIILCSDGLDKKLSVDEIQTIVEANDPEIGCRTLVDMANQRGGEDNISCLIVRLAARPSLWKGVFQRLFRR